MIQMGTILEVADNSGAKKIACIHLRGALGQYGHLGDVITASVKEATPDGTVKKGAGRQGGDRAHRSSAERRRDGSYIRFDTNAAVLINDNQRADRHPRLRAGGARAAREEVHEDHLAGAGSHLREPRERRQAMKKTKIKKNDQVLVIAGKDRGREGQGPAGASRARSMAIVERVNMVKRHTQPEPAARGSRAASSRRRRRSSSRTSC